MLEMMIMTNSKWCESDPDSKPRKYGNGNNSYFKNRTTYIEAGTENQKASRKYYNSRTTSMRNG